MKLDSAQHWQLFGYDMRHLGRYWMAAWRDLLFSHDSPIRHRLDEVVTLRSAAGTRSYQAGKACSSVLESECTAVLVPDDLVLSKTISIPIQAESELSSLLDLEVRSSSPFAAQDTRWGWSVVTRSDATIEVVLAIVSASAVMTFLGREYDSHDTQAQEVWVELSDVMVVLQGFGEGLRERRYQKRLQHSAGLFAVIAILLLSMAAVSALYKTAELDRVERLSATTAAAARQASDFRGLLTVANETIGAANDVVANYPNPHIEIARLTALLDDDVYISSLSVDGRQMEMRGRALDAAKVLELLTNEPAYASVAAPGPTVRLSDGFEQFHLKILIDSEALP